VSPLGRKKKRGGRSHAKTKKEGGRGGGRWRTSLPAHPQTHLFEGGGKGREGRVNALVLSRRPPRAYHILVSKKKAKGEGRFEYQRDHPVNWKKKGGPLREGGGEGKTICVLLSAGRPALMHQEERMGNTERCRPWPPQSSLF